MMVGVSRSLQPILIYSCFVAKLRVVSVFYLEKCVVSVFFLSWVSSKHNLSFQDGMEEVLHSETNGTKVGKYMELFQVFSFRTLKKRERGRKGLVDIFVVFRREVLQEFCLLSMNFRVVWVSQRVM